MDLGPRLPPEVRDSPASARAGPHISTLSTSRVGVAEITARSGRPAATLVASDAPARGTLAASQGSSQRDGPASGTVCAVPGGPAVPVTVTQ